VIITVTLDRLEKAAGGVTTTATGGLLPLGDALKLAERAHPVLGLFDHDWLRGPRPACVRCTTCRSGATADTPTSTH
jgi:hypothetical protein